MKIGSMLPVVVMLLAAALFAAPEDARMSAAAGVVATVDNATSSLTVKLNGPKGEARELTFVVIGDSKIIKSSTAIALAELKQGDKVTVTYRSEGGKNIVVNIGVESHM